MRDAFSTQFFKNMVFNDPTYDTHRFNFDSDLAFTDASIARVINATDPDLRPLKRRDGKIIMWHGWNDPAIAPQYSINYYESVVADQGGEAKTQEFVRLFMVPGMGHCSGGAGPTTFDALAAVEQWVENGTAPSELAGSHATKGTVDYTRPICMYPQLPKYSGSGDTTDAANFTCAAP